MICYLFSMDLVKYCRDNDILYLDTCIEPWAGYYTDSTIPPERRSNYALRQSVLDLRAELGTPGPTAIMAHGANPGLVNHFVKNRDIAALNPADPCIPHPGGNKRHACAHPIPLHNNPSGLRARERHTKTPSSRRNQVRALPTTTSDSVCA